MTEVTFVVGISEFEFVCGKSIIGHFRSQGVADIFDIRLVHNGALKAITL